jgi:hypothetical protein
MLRELKEELDRLRAELMVFSWDLLGIFIVFLWDLLAMFMIISFQHVCFIIKALAAMGDTAAIASLEVLARKFFMII